MNDIKVPPFTDGQQELIKITEKLANGRKICDVDDIDDEIKDIKEMVSETIAKIENQKQTNFSRITSSHEALAEFICDISFYFPWDDSEFCCRYNLETEQDRLHFVKKWLKQESEG